MPKRGGVLLATVLFSALVGGCVSPPRVDPACTASGTDAAALTDALRFANQGLSQSIRVYRHGCLAGQGGYEAQYDNVGINLWSATKGVTSLVVGRAITMGRLGLDDPIGRYLPEADSAHGAITIRQLLTQSSGLRFSWADEGNPGLYDSVRYVLSLPFAHDPGTYFEYAQAPLTLLLEVVRRAIDEDVVSFAQREIFEPIGIGDARWSWLRDRTGHPLGYAGVIMRPRDMVQLGTLMLHHGAWGDRQLVAADYMAHLQESSPTNPGYGFLTWTNEGSWHYSASIGNRQRREHRWIESAPADTYVLSGLGDQMIWVVPTWDMVIVRTGLPTGPKWKYDLFRRLRRVVTDVDSGPLAPYVQDRPQGVDDYRVLVDPEIWPR